MSTEIKAAVESLNRDWQEFKAANEAGRTELADKINKGLSATEDQIEGLKTAIARSGALDKHNELKEIKSSKKGLKMIRELAAKENEFSSFLRSKSGIGEFATPGWEAKTTNIGSDASAQGGYGIPTVIQPTVDMIIQETSPIESLAQVTNVGYASDGFHGVINLNTAAATWGAEPNTPPYNTTDRPATDTTTFARIDIKYWELFANNAVTLQAIEDVQFDLEAEILKATADKLARARAAAFVNGAGDSSYQPKGFAAYSTNDLGSNAASVTALNTITSGTAQAITGDDIMNLVYGLRTGYENGAAFAMHRLVMEKVRELKTTTGQYLWNPTDVNGAYQPALAAGQAGTLLGYPVYRFNDMHSALNDSATVPVITFAKWNEFYRIVNRVGLMMLRDPYSQTGQVIFKTRQRVGGGMFNGVAGVSLLVKQS